MRNLKRALSLALASVMLLGMMVVGSSAASVEDFTDVDSIGNYEAVSIATGLGIFDGYDDGSFGPEKVVTRAEAAVVISKILYGADVNPTNFVGTAKFTDVPAWAEGWVNLAYTNGIIVGYDEKTFGPNDPVTTAQFATMLLKALGYYNNGVDVLDGDWELTVTAKANALGIYGDLELPMSEGLVRENVAEMAFNALFAQRVAFNDYRGQYVKTNDRDVVVTNGTVDASNTLAQNVFGLYTTEGTVIANGMTDEDLAASVKSKAMTTVLFADEADLDQDGKFEIAADETFDFVADTGLDMIGHDVKIYYTIEKKTPVVFSMIDQASLVAIIDYAAEDKDLADAANDAGFKKNTILNIDEAEYIVNYDMDTTYDESFDLDKLIVISNSSDKEVDCVIALDQVLTKVEAIDEDDDEIEYTLADVDADLAIALDDVDEDEFVIATNIGNNDEIVVFEAATVMSADITKLTGVSNVNADLKKVVADGETYTKSTVDVADYSDDLFTAFADIDEIGTFTLVIDTFGDLIGITTEKSVPNYAYVAQYGVVHTTGTLNTTHALTAHVYFADGTDGIYTVKSFKDADGDAIVANTTKLNMDEFEEEMGLDALNGSAALAGDAYKGIWNVKISGDMVNISELVVEETEDGTAGAAEKGVSIVKGLSTFVKDKTAATREPVYGCASEAILYQNNDTVYFYVYGEYDDGIDVDVYTGVKTVPGFENGENGENTGIQEVFSGETTKSGRLTVSAVLADDPIAAKEDDTVYFYNNGNYHIAKNADGKYELTYEVFDMTGASVEVTYTYSSASAAKADAADKYDGFYQALKGDLTAYKDVAHSVADEANDYEDELVSKTYYVLNDVAAYDEYIENLYAKYNTIGAIAEDVKIVDACDSGITSVAKLIRAITDKDTNGEVYISYVYSLTDYVIDVIFVNTYDPVDVEAPGSSTDKVTATFESVTYDEAGVLAFEGTEPTKSVKVVVEVFSAINGEWKTYFDGVVKADDEGNFTVKLPANQDYLADIKVTVDGKEATKAEIAE